MIYYDGRQLMYRDISTNGTMINNQRIHKRAVPIRRGDIIMLAGKYQLNWNQIDYYFPPPIPSHILLISPHLTNHGKNHF